MFSFQAIFNDDLRDLRTPSVWNKWTPLDISITLSPFQGSRGLREVHAQVDLRITCSEKYPDVYVNKKKCTTRYLAFVLQRTGLETGKESGRFERTSSGAAKTAGG